MSDLIKREDAISAERKGKWETAGKRYPYARCSLCGRVRVSCSSRFCDWCGAKMDVERKESE